MENTIRIEYGLGSQINSNSFDVFPCRCIQNQLITTAKKLLTVSLVDFVKIILPNSTLRSKKPRSTLKFVYIET